MLEKQLNAKIILFIGTLIDQQVLINNNLNAGLTDIGCQWIGLQTIIFKFN